MAAAAYGTRMKLCLHDLLSVRGNPSSLALLVAEGESASVPNTCELGWLGLQTATHKALWGGLKLVWLDAFQVVRAVTVHLAKQTCS